ncbi:diheme Cytochrome C [Sulfuricella denitrificans skB26]|uniref:Diheme Cytochrome C n=1 Tax=Sulfuricella denitrificans (strain DSM 22764 / NBRC 105220 / skB26) TaxID=1163617 RepID=S6B0W0_SULDS|nr:diheme cytochrome c [Sulfuricella denitrificans]BAN34322.1 diheme Cytochrome C [Sulfuricella denitrificans skB26]
MKIFIAILLIALSSSALADGRKLAVPGNPLWQTECGSCHMAYPPQLLTAANWRQMMKGLDSHFGANATLDAKEGAEILAFLERYAARDQRYSANTQRITDTAWFQREHREVSNSVWTHAKVKSRANCTACHVTAERGDWSEHSIRMPDGRRWE